MTGIAPPWYTYAMATLLTTVQAARRLHLSRYWLWQLVRSGKLKARRVGRDWLIDPADLEAMPRPEGAKRGRKPQRKSKAGKR